MSTYARVLPRLRRPIPFSLGRSRLFDLTLFGVQSLSILLALHMINNYHCGKKMTRKLLILYVYIGYFRPNYHSP